MTLILWSLRTKKRVAKHSRMTLPVYYLMTVTMIRPLSVVSLVCLSYPVLIVQDSAYSIHYIYVGEDNDEDMLFTRLARWAQDIPRQKYIELKRMLESQGIFFLFTSPPVTLAKLTGA